MIITYLGHSCFKLESKENPAILITDPFDKETGLKMPRVSADIVTISHGHHDHSHTEAVKGTTDTPPFIINLPGEYELKNIFVYGIPSFHDNENGKIRGGNIIYRIEIDGISIAHLGDLGHIPTGEILGALEGVDILMIPVGGTYTIDAKEANYVIGQIEPRIVIPMHYKMAGSTVKVDPVDVFLKEMGISNPEMVEKLKISKKDLPQESMQIIVMTV